MFRTTLIATAVVALALAGPAPAQFGTANIYSQPAAPQAVTGAYYGPQTSLGINYSPRPYYLPQMNTVTIYSYAATPQVLPGAYYGPQATVGTYYSPLSYYSPLVRPTPATYYAPTYIVPWGYTNSPLYSTSTYLEAPVVYGPTAWNNSVRGYLNRPVGYYLGGGQYLNPVNGARYYGPFIRP
jgi:hypothetical protein